MKWFRPSWIMSNTFVAGLGVALISMGLHWPLLVSFGTGTLAGLFASLLTIIASR